MISVGIVGATGYTGAELVRFLVQHPHVRLTSLAGRRTAGQSTRASLPSLQALSAASDRVPESIESFDPDRMADTCEAVFTALPHGTSAGVVSALRRRGLPVFDLSADFRLRDPEVYRRWYGEHGAADLLPSAVYGLPELFGSAIRAADLVAVPGCYPTATLLACAPLVTCGALRGGDPIVVDAKSGVSGAGRDPKAATHFAAVSEGIRAYAGPGRHRHTPEIEEVLRGLGSDDVRVLFSPHLVPMIRGILSTSYAAVSDPQWSATRITEVARAAYDSSPFVQVLDPESFPDTAWIKGSNRALVSYSQDKASGWLVAQCAIDNLVKGAAGQAIQCLNVRMGFEESAGLQQVGVWP